MELSIETKVAIAVATGFVGLIVGAMAQVTESGTGGTNQPLAF